MESFYSRVARARISRSLANIVEQARAFFFDFKFRSIGFLKPTQKHTGYLRTEK